MNVVDSPSKVSAVSSAQVVVVVADVNLYFNLSSIKLFNPEWLKRKKGHVFMPLKERREILNSLEAVSQVMVFDDSDDTELQQDYREEWERICKTMEQLEKLAGINRVKETHNYEEVV